MKPPFTARYSFVSTRAYLAARLWTPLCALLGHPSVGWTPLGIDGITRHFHWCRCSRIWDVPLGGDA